MENNQLTQSELKELLHYDKDTGVFTWLVALSPRVRVGGAAGCVWEAHGGKSYKSIRIKGKLHQAHRLAFLYMEGKFPDDQTDHIDGCGTNNKWVNLRKVSGRENKKNARRHSNNTSGTCGVFWDSSKLLWRALIDANRERYHIGYFKNLSDAIKARKSAEIEHGFHKNHGQDRPL
jgi:hypothetical protein